MKHKFALLTIVGALLALAAPASSMGSMYPAGAKFEIVGNSAGPKLSTSLGSCSLSKITGQIPAAPANVTPAVFAIPTPTVGACSAGASLALAGEWRLNHAGYYVTLQSTSAEAITLRFTSLPGCKLTGAQSLIALWSNGTTTPTLLKSGYHAHRGFSLKWANDGASCALAGKSEAISFGDDVVSGELGVGVAQTVENLTTPSAPIIVGN